ncbi:MAG: NAD(P)H-hydrate epimerase, partial [Calditrichota bacterium]
MQKVVTSKEMREMDRFTINELGIPGAVLMENAGLGTARVIEKLVREIGKPTVYIFCGKGNNGGDGFVISRHLWDNGIQVQVFIAGDEKEIKGDALINYKVIKKLALPIKFISTDKDLRSIDQQAPDVIVDALLGTGIKGAVHGFFKNVIDFINGLDCPVVAVDLPSGLNAD